MNNEELTYKKIMSDFLFRTNMQTYNLPKIHKSYGWIEIDGIAHPLEYVFYVENTFIEGEVVHKLNEDKNVKFMF